MQYFIVMIDYPGAREAVVNPEITRREIISRIASGEYDRERISFIHRVRDCTVEDVTAELTDEAQTLRLEAAE